LSSLVTEAILTKSELKLEKLEKLANDSKLELADIKACVALIDFILKSSANHYVNSNTVNNELQQLGLPKEHSTSICRVYEDNQSKLKNHLLDSTFRSKITS
jgi:COMM domain containing 4